MSPSKNVRRAGALATGSFLLAMAASPAYAGTTGLGPTPPKVGDSCTSALDAVLKPLGLTCVGSTVQTILSTLPVPTTAPIPAPTTPSTSPAPDPITGTVNGVTKTVTGVTKTVTGAVGNLTGGLSGVPSPAATLPGTPSGVTPTTAPTSSGKGSSKGTTSGSSGTSRKTLSNGSSLLGPAAAFLPGSSVASFADLSSGSLQPLADNIPSPLLAGPDAKLAAVQAPLIAAGDRASSNADSIFARFGGKALPGILVVIGTAMVAAVGAGNLRAWQARLANRKPAASGS